jgi:hypothetical protein
MNCHEAYLWMLEVEQPTVSPPDPVIDHLRGCSKCRRRQKRVLRLLTTVRSLPAPPENPLVRAEVLSLVRQQPLAAVLPLSPLSPRHGLKQLRRWLLRPAALVAVVPAAIVLFSLFGGGLLYYFYEPSNSGNLNQVQGNDPSQRVWNDGDLRTRLLEHTLNLANAKAPGDQLDALTDMAADLESESLAQAGQVDNAQLMRLAVLYERVVEEGILPHAFVLSPESRQQKLLILVAEFQQTATKTEQAAKQKPAAAEPLLRVSLAAGRAFRLLNNPIVQLPPPKQPQAPEGPLLEALVLHGLVLADENDPLKRAEVSTDVADNLVRTILESSQRGSDRDEMEKLGTYLGAVMNRGVNGNLDRVDPKTLDAKRQADYERLKQRAAEMMARFQRNMQDAPPHSRQGLQQAFQASRFGRFNFGPPHFGKDMDKDKHWSKGKH